MPDINLLEQRLREAYEGIWESFVDPREAVCDSDGTEWSRLGLFPTPGHSAAAALATESQLTEARNECRALALGNEFAINGHENRISYIVGPGHAYRAAERKDSDAAPELVAAVQQLLDQFLEQNRWHHRQQEIIRRYDRDGEVFLRFFVPEDGLTRVRFVEPEQVAMPPARVSDASASFGVQTAANDVEDVRGYYVDGELIAADDMQHRKANVDANVKRGIPLFYAVRHNLRRAEKLLRNMSVVAEIQTAIALIRKHHGRGKSTVQKFVAGQAERVTADPATGRQAVHQRFGPGTILDADANIEYDFPAAGVDAANFITVLQAELRAIASRLVMPEFMLTSDASNANYSSTMIAEGPAIRMFQRLQADQVTSDRAVMRRVMRDAVFTERLPARVLNEVEILIEPPSLSIRDAFKEAQVSRIEHEHGILSPQTWSQRRGLDYAQEQTNWQAHRLAQSAGADDEGGATEVARNSR